MAISALSLSNAIYLLCTSAILYIVILAIYRITFHPLARYPGPLLAKVSVLYASYHAYLRDIHLDIHRCHLKYGDYIRYGPNHLIVNTAEGMHDIYGYKAPTKKSTWYAMARRTGGASIISAYDKAEHAPKRRVIGQAFSESRLRDYESTILQHVKVFFDKITQGCPSDREEGEEGGWGPAMNMAHWCDYLTFDTMLSIVFDPSEPFSLLTDPTHRPISQHIEDTMYNLSVLAWWPMWTTTGGKLGEIFLPKETQGRQRFLDTTYQVTRDRVARAQKEGDGGEKKEAQKGDIFGHLIDAKDPETGQKMNIRELAGNAAVLVVGGTDTASCTMAAFFFYLTRNPHVYETLRTEILSTLGPPPSSPTTPFPTPLLKSTPYLSACIDEALRIAPPFPGALWRETTTPITLSNTHPPIPAGTQISTGLYAIHHNSSYFPDPYTFLPERWLSDQTRNPYFEKLDIARKAFAPFQLGSRACVGKGLALRELHIALGYVIWRADFRVATSENGCGSTGGGGEGNGWIGRKRQWGREREDEYQLLGHFTSGKEGPCVQFRVRR